MVLITLFCGLILAKDAAVPIGTMTDPELREVSGIVRSRTYPDVYWVHNDSGNPPALFAVRGNGTLIRRYDVSAPNVDWEDIAADSSGHLFLGDIGNNGGHLPVRLIYRLDEPDPSVAPAGPLKATLAASYRMPKKARFDAESLAIDGNSALIVTKRFDGGEAILKSVELVPAASLLRPAKPSEIGPLAGFVEPATGADLSEDGNRLAVVSLARVRVYERRGDQWKPIGEAKFKGDGVEAVAWDGDDLVLAGEGRGLYRITSKKWREKKGPKS